ncbi:CRTAC1 family protein [candidate division KSB1 bacterium]
MRRAFFSTNPIAALVCGLLLGWAPSRVQSAGPVFTEVAAQAGISFNHTFGDGEMSSILEATGSGCAFLDYDGDGFLDLYVVNGCFLPGISDPVEIADQTSRETNKLFRNNGDGTFEDVTARAGIGDTGYGMGCLVGDYDNDGDPDIYVTNYGRNTLYRNNGDGSFRDITVAAGVGDESWGIGAAFLDFDNDGDLDLYLGNYLEFDPQYRLYYAADEFPGPLAYPGQADVLYRNNGDGTFSDITEAAGVSNEGRAMGVTSADYDGDGWADIFVANDAMENFLFHNNGDGTFTELGLEAGVGFSENGDATSSMSGDFADFDGDGDLDLLVPDMTYGSLYVNRDGAGFQDMSFSLGLAIPCGQYVSWDGRFFDYDNDGDLDIYISNGDAHRLDTMEDLLLANDLSDGSGSGKFRDVGDEAGPVFRQKSVSRGVTVGDYDNDGDQDVFIVDLARPSRLLRNDGGNRGNWLQIMLRGAESNRDGIGAKVILKSGDLVRLTERISQRGYLGHNDPRLHFGLGERDRVDEIEVRWPSGVVQKVKPKGINRLITIVEGEG